MSSIIYMCVKGKTQGLISAWCGTFDSIGNFVRVTEIKKSDPILFEEINNKFLSMEWQMRNKTISLSVFISDLLLGYFVVLSAVLVISSFFYLRMM